MAAEQREYFQTLPTEDHGTYFAGCLGCISDTRNVILAYNYDGE